VKAPEPLLEFLAIPSVSTDPARKEDVRRAALWLEERLKALGFRTELLETPLHPILYAERLVDPKAPTVLVYGHYDVQPPDPLELWESPPFSPTVREGRLYARGASDDKGQLFAHLLAAEGAPVNLKFLVEGEEEVGSPHLLPFVRANRERLAADLVLVSDGAMVAPTPPPSPTASGGFATWRCGFWGRGGTSTRGPSGAWPRTPSRPWAGSSPG